MSKGKSASFASGFTFVNVLVFHEQKYR